MRIIDVDLGTERARLLELLGTSLLMESKTISGTFRFDEYDKHDLLVFEESLHDFDEFAEVIHERARVDCVRLSEKEYLYGRPLDLAIGYFGPFWRLRR